MEKVRRRGEKERPGSTGDTYVDPGVHFGSPALGVLAGGQGIGVEDAGQLNFELDGAVLVEDPVDAVLVVGGREDLGDNELAAARHDGRAVAEIRVFEQDAGILLVDADGVLDGDGRARAIAKLCI